MNRATSATAGSPGTSATRRLGRRRTAGSSRAASQKGWVLPSDGYRWALWLLLLLSLSQIHQHFTFIGTLRPALLTAGIALMFAVASPNKLNWRTLKTRPARLMLALVVIACISVPFGISMGNSGKFLLDAYFRVVMAYVLVTLAMRGCPEISQFVWVFVFSCAILSWMATSVFSLTGGRLGDMYMYDSNDVGVLLVMGIPLALLAFETSERAGKLASAGILIWIGLAIARTGSRGAFLGIVAMVPVFLVWARHISVQRRLTIVGVIFGGMLIAAPFGYWEQMQTLTNPTEDYNWNAEDGRRKVAIRGMGYMLSNPLTGLGVNNFSKAEWTISGMAEDEFRQRGIKGSASHNTWIQAGAEMGIPGLILYLMFVFGTLAVVVRERRRLPQSWRRGDREQRFLYATSVYLPLSILGYAVTCTFVSFAYMDPMYFLASLAAGFLFSVHRKRRQLTAPSVSPQTRPISGRRRVTSNRKLKRLKTRPSS